MTTTANVPKKDASAVKTRGNAYAEPLMLRKRIGSTTFEISVNFSQTSRETMQDKIQRLIKREAEDIA